MGSPLAPVLANFFMGPYEKLWLNNYTGPKADLWDGDVIIPRLRILYWKPAGFQEKSLVIVSLMANNFDISKIPFVVVFVDKARDLGVMVKHNAKPVCVPF